MLHEYSVCRREFGLSIHWALLEAIDEAVPSMAQVEPKGVGFSSTDN